MNEALQRNIHALIRKYDDYFVATCLNASIVTDGATLDETVVNLQEAVGLYLEDEDLAEFGFVPDPGIVLTYEIESVRAQA